VKLRLIAYDSGGHVAGGLKREDVHVYAGGVEQPLTSFAVDVSPASYGLVVDNSGSLRSQIGAVIVAAQALALANGPSDETFVVRFVSSDEIKIMQDFTADKRALTSVLGDMFIEGGQTAVLDAVYLSGDHLSTKMRADAGVVRRRALVLITDGGDRASYYKADQVLKLLRERDVQVFAIGLTSELGNGHPPEHDNRRKSRKLLERLTSETGGRVFYAEKVGELREAISEIEKALHTQYVVGYAQAAGAPRPEVRAYAAGGTESLAVVLRPDPSDPSPESKDKKRED
jgi:Ca-activated chloride channel family protein